MKGRLNGGKQEWVPLRDLNPHPELQRTFDQRRATKYAKDFNPAALGVLVLVETRNGKRWLIDGQHRRAAALEFVDGDATQEVLCIIHRIADDAEAAKLVRQLNDYKRWNALKAFQNRVTEKDSAAVAVTEILSRYQLRVAATRGDGTVQAVDACENVFAASNGAKVLDATVRTLWNSWGRDPDAFHSQLIRGLALFLRKYGGDVDETDLFRKLAKSGTPLALIGRSRELKSIMQNQLPHAVAECIRQIYNKGRRSGGLAAA